MQRSARLRLSGGRRYGIIFWEYRINIHEARRDERSKDDAANAGYVSARRDDGQVTIEINAVGGPFRKWLQITDFRAGQTCRGGVHIVAAAYDLIRAMLYGIWGSMTLLPERTSTSGRYYPKRCNISDRRICIIALLICRICLAILFFPPWPQRNLMTNSFDREHNFTNNAIIAISLFVA